MTATSLRVYHNVCPHRAGPGLAAAACAGPPMPYHGWTYGGWTATAERRRPRSTGLADSDIACAPLAVATWGHGVRRRRFQEHPTSRDFVDERPARLAPTAWKATPPSPPRLRSACNWKVYVDNYLEGYHIPLVHPELHKVVWTTSATAPSSIRWWSLTYQHAPLRPIPGGTPGRSAATGPSASDEEAQYLLGVPQPDAQHLPGPAADQRGGAAGRRPHSASSSSGSPREPPDDPATDDKWTRLIEFSDLLQVQDTSGSARPCSATCCRAAPAAAATRRAARTVCTTSTRCCTSS